MTPHVQSAGGTLMLDRVFTGIGRLHFASGFSREHSAQFRLFNDALTEMAKESAGREWIRALQRREVTCLDLWATYKKGKWREAPRPETAKPLVEALEAWREDTHTGKDAVADSTYKGRKHLITQIKAAARAGALIDELPTIFREVKRRMAKTAPVEFNQCRNYLRAFLRDTFGKRHELYQVIQYDIGPIEVRGQAKKRERKHRPLTPAQLLTFAAAFPKIEAHGRKHDAEGHGHHAIQMAMIGANPKEYFEDGWTAHATHVHVDGEKRRGRDRMVPKLFPSALWPHLTLKKPSIKAKAFGRAFRLAVKASGIQCTPLDLRRSFAVWILEAGIDSNRRRVYRGHSTKTMGELYEAPGELLEHLVGDGKRIVTWINQQLELAQRPKVAQEGR